jgi:hypothetical protein
VDEWLTSSNTFLWDLLLLEKDFIRLQTLSILIILSNLMMMFGNDTMIFGNDVKNFAV